MSEAVRAQSTVRRARGQQLLLPGGIAGLANQRKLGTRCEPEILVRSLRPGTAVRSRLAEMDALFKRVFDGLPVKGDI